MALSERAARPRGFSVLRLGAAAVPDFEFRNLGRMLLHAALVGALTGLVGSLFFVALEIVQRLLLEETAGYRPLKAQGEALLPSVNTAEFRPWLLMLLP